jgi:diacylglycerol kinase (ATP)
VRRLLVLVNPSAGGVDADAPDADGPVARALAALREVGEVEVLVLSDDAEADVRARAGALGAEDLLVVAGGDGTLHRTVALLDPPAVPVLVVPAGTGNDFATTLGMPTDPAAAARVVETGRVRRLDLVQVGDRTSVNAAHLGVGVSAAEAAADLKGALGKLAYPVGAVAAAARFDPVVVTVDVDGERVLDAEPVALVAVCNGRTVGGGTVLCPPADPGDGRADLVVLRAATATSLAATTADLLRERHLDRDDVLHHPAERVEVEVHDAGTAMVTWNVDGELLERPAAVRCEVRAGAWRVLAP